MVAGEGTIPGAQPGLRSPHRDSRLPTEKVPGQLDRPSWASCSLL